MKNSEPTRNADYGRCNIWGTLRWQTDHAYCRLVHHGGLIRCVKHRPKRPWWRRKFFRGVGR